jgi:hypothetical protein
VGNQVMSGKALAENINDAFVSVTKESPPLNRPHIDFLPENSHYDISPEFIIKEEEVYHKLSIISTAKSPGPDGIPNWVLKFLRLCTCFPCCINFECFHPTSDCSDHVEKSKCHPNSKNSFA